MASQKHKSNKTAHVLNLLASNAPEEEESSAAVEPDSQPAKAVEAKKTEGTAPASTDSETSPTIPIVSPLGETGDPLDAVIQGNLELELTADLIEKEQEARPAPAEKPKFIPGFPAGFVPPEPAVAEPPKPEAPQTEVPTSSAVQQREHTAAPAPTQHGIQAGAPAPTSQQEIPASAPVTPSPQQEAQASVPVTPSSQQEVQASAPVTSPSQQEAPTAAPVSASTRQETDTSAPTTVQQDIQATPPAPSSAAETLVEPSAPEPKKPELPSYQYINVMEQLVDGRVMEAMKMFEMCTCERCQIDVKALALTYLMPKYIVVDRGYSSPLLNFYSNKFSTDTMTQLTKACTIVQKYPRH